MIEVDNIESLFVSAAFIALTLSAVPLIISTVVGLVFSVLQAATQIQEQTLGFVPKLAAVSAALYFGGRWLSSQLIDYFVEILHKVPEF
ncbi:MAG: flagellar biosynthetic protein FliQ [Deltaproteobacteria bacterium]|nr:flagellar biosynthetic protein FliQ [Deltaproteobacteria bacterium]